MEAGLKLIDKSAKTDLQNFSLRLFFLFPSQRPRRQKHLSDKMASMLREVYVNFKYPSLRWNILIKPANPKTRAQRAFSKPKSPSSSKAPNAPSSSTAQNAQPLCTQSSRPSTPSQNRTPSFSTRRMRISAPSNPPRASSFWPTRTRPEWSCSEAAARSGPTASH